MAGDYTLIMDSDKQMPKDCFLDSVNEMDQPLQLAWGNESQDFVL